MQPVGRRLIVAADWRGSGILKPVPAETVPVAAARTAPAAAAVRAIVPTAELFRFLAHETRTPLNAVQGCAELMLAGAAGPFNAATLDYLRQIGGAARSIETVIARLLGLAEAAADLAGSVPARTDLVPLLAEAGFALADKGGMMPHQQSFFAPAGDPAAWAMVFLACRTYLRGGVANATVEARLAADGHMGPELRLVVAGPGRRAANTCRIELDLAERIATRMGVRLLLSGAGEIVLNWAESPRPSGTGTTARMGSAMMSSR